ncbi:hypothetical protein H4R33_004346 [Dimargaris cristalligena]|nr:hypothetical protein H4R33_004346 [Dimargaris cristalligena]
MIFPRLPSSLRPIRDCLLDSITPLRPVAQRDRYTLQQLSSAVPPRNSVGPGSFGPWFTESASLPNCTPVQLTDSPRATHTFTPPTRRLYSTRSGPPRSACPIRVWKTRRSPILPANPLSRPLKKSYNQIIVEFQDNFAAAPEPLQWLDQWLAEHHDTLHRVMAKRENEPDSIIYRTFTKYIIRTLHERYPVKDTEIPLGTRNRAICMYSRIGALSTDRLHMVTDPIHTQLLAFIQTLKPHRPGQAAPTEQFDLTDWHPNVFHWAVRTARKIHLPWYQTQTLYLLIQPYLTPECDALYQHFVPLCLARADVPFVGRIIDDLIANHVRLKPHHQFQVMKFLTTHRDPRRGEAFFNGTLGHQGTYAEAMHAELIRLYGQSASLVPRCLDVYETMLSQDITPGFVTFSALANSFASHGEVKHTIRVVRRVRDSSDRMSPYLAALILKAFFKRGWISRVIPVFRQLQEGGYTMNSVSYNILLGAYVWQNDTAMVAQTLHLMAGKDIEPTVYTYTFLIQTFMASKQFDQCLRIYQSMLDSGIRPSAVTLTVLLPLIFEVSQSGLANYPAGLAQLPSASDLSTPSTLLGQVRASGIKPNAELLRRIIEALWSQNHYPEALLLWRNISRFQLRHSWASLTNTVAHLMIHHELHTNALEFLDHASAKFPALCHTIPLYQTRFLLAYRANRCDQFIPLYRQMLDHGLLISSKFIALSLAYTQQRQHPQLTIEIAEFLQQMGIRSLPSHHQIERLRRSLTHPSTSPPIIASNPTE